jgi:hypothetical protein
MALNARSDDTALEHSLAILLEQPPIASTDTDLPKFRACFNEAGGTCASDFILISPSSCGGTLFSSTNDGADKDSALNVMQIKKLSALVSWFRQFPAPSAAKWFDLSEAAFRSWRTQPATLSVSAATAPAAATAITAISAIADFRKGVKRSISDCKAFKEDRCFDSWQRHLQTTARSHNVDNVINLLCVPTNQDEQDLLNEQKKFVHSVLEQTVSTPDGILIIRFHSDAGDATAVHSDLVDRCSESTAAQLAASELESDLAEFRVDSSWTKTNQAFLIAWTAKTLDLDSVLEQPITESQKRIWFTCAAAPKAVLSLAVSQFDASKRLTAIGIGSSHAEARFSILCDHVKDVAMRADQTERICQSTPRQVHEAKTNPPSAPDETGNSRPTSAAKTFLGKDGQMHSCVAPREKHQAMTPKERITALAEIRAAKGLASKVPCPPRESRRFRNPAPPSDAPTPKNTMLSCAEVTDPAPTPSVVSGVTQPPPALSSNSLRQVLTSNRVPTSTNEAAPPTDTKDDLVSFDGRFYRCVSSASVSYDLSNHAYAPVLSSLIDGGANGGMAGNNVRVLSESSFNKANVTGIGDSLIQDLSLATVAGLTSTHKGFAIGIFNQCANYGKGHTMHSSTQLHTFGTLLHEAPRSTGGVQRLIAPDGCHIPLSYRAGPPHMDMRPPADVEIDTLPHVLLTGDDAWNPSCMDDEFSVQDLLLDTPVDTGDQDPRVNDFGECTGNLEEDIDLIINECRAERQIENDCSDIPGLLQPRIKNQRTVSKAAPNLEALRPNFGWLPIKRIKKTLQATTQFARTDPCYPFRKHCCTCWPAANVDWWNKDVATDTFFSDTPAHDDGIFGHSGCTMAQTCAGKCSSKLVAHGVTKRIPDAQHSRRPCSKTRRF